jgi:hypothetical protein
MKTFEQLTQEQQQIAVDRCLTDLLTDICNGTLGFNDELNHDDLQKRIDTAFAEAESMQTPWFAHEYIMDTCREDLEAMARPTAEDALYPEPHENCIGGIAV